jgi:hypothetical protein
MRTRVPRRPIVFLRFRCSICVCCSILILLIRKLFVVAYATVPVSRMQGRDLINLADDRDNLRLPQNAGRSPVSWGAICCQVEYRCARCCYIGRPPWATLPSCGELSDRERWCFSGVLDTMVCLRAASIVPLFYTGHWSVSNTVECKLPSLCVPIVTHFRLLLALLTVKCTIHRPVRILRQYIGQM